MSATAEFLKESSRFLRSLRFGIEDINITRQHAKAAYYNLFVERYCTPKDEVSISEPVTSLSASTFSTEFSSEFQ